MSVENQSSLPASDGLARFAGKLDRLQCVNFQGLKKWQIKKYTDAVSKHRKLMSRTLGSFCVDWEEAERDYSESDVVRDADQWRHQYCGSICPFRNSCLLGYQFRMASDESNLAETG